MATARFTSHYEPQSLADHAARRERERKLRAAMAWLEVELADGAAHPASDVLARGEAAGHAQRTLQRASEVLGVKKQRERAQGKVAGWTWTRRAMHQRPKSTRKGYTIAP